MTNESEAGVLRAAKDAAYRERDHLVCALSKVFPSYLARHPESDTSWENDWRWIVFVELPAGQASWHIHDSERAWFDHLEVRADGKWDGHTTEQKYERLAALRQRGPVEAPVPSAVADAIAAIDEMEYAYERQMKPSARLRSSKRP
jgi:hypothetical protein